MIGLITFLDFEKADDFGIKKQESLDSLDILDNLLRKENLQNSKIIKGYYYLFKSPDRIKSFNFISNKGLEYPKVYENDKIVMNKEFHDQMQHGMKWIGHLLVGTSNGDCFFVEFGETKKGKFKRSQTQWFSRGQLVEKKEVLLRIKKRSIDNDESGDEPKEEEENDGKECEEEKQSTKNNKSFYVKDCKRFMEEKMEIFLINQYYKTDECNKYDEEGENKEGAKLYIFVRLEGKNWISNYVDIEKWKLFEIKDRFEIYKMKKKNSNYRFFIEGCFQLILLSVNPVKQKINVEKFLSIKGRYGYLLQYSFFKNIFFISPYRNIIKVWGDDLRYPFHTIEFDSKVKEMSVMEEGDQKRLLVYDKTKYYEFDIENLNLRLEKQIYDPKLFLMSLPFNLSLYPKNEEFKVPIFKNKLNDISFFLNYDILYFNEFPFDHLLGSISTNNYYHHIKEFAKYYFSKIKATNYIDSQYGPLNPLILAIFHNDIDLLKELLEKYPYPKEVNNYWSPLAYAFVQNYKSIVKFLCEYLYKTSPPVKLSDIDFKYLLKSDYSYCQKLISTIPSEPTLANFPCLLYMEKEVQVNFVKNRIDMLTTIKEDETKKLNKISQRNRKKRKGIQKNNEQNISKTEVHPFEIPFKYSYASGSPDSLRFLDTFSKSNTEEFILSEWKELITHKWKYHQIFNILLAIIYWALTVITTYSVVFRNDYALMRYLSLGFIGFFVLYDILQLFSYSAFRLRRYFEEAWNYIDWLCYGLLISYFVLYEREKQSTKVTRVLGSTALMVLYYRSFSYLRIIDSFTTLIGMINTIIIKLIVFFLILIYFFVASSLLIMKLNPKENTFSSLGNAYVWTFFGGIGGEDFESFDLAAIPIIFGTIMVTVILLNILIAFLSNLFSRLEDKQKADNYKEKASMILDLEVIIHFFLYWLTGKARKYKQYEEKKEDYYSVKVLEIPKKISYMLEDRKILYIFKSVDSEDSSKEITVDDNIYKMVKSLTKSFEEFRSEINENLRGINDNKKTLQAFRSQIDSNTKIQEALKSNIDNNTKTLEAFNLKFENHIIDQKKLMKLIMERLRKD